MSKEELAAVKEELIQEAVTKATESADDLITLKPASAPFDPRFPATNQARHCFVRYNEYYKCLFDRGEENERCQFYKHAYESLCPSDWVEEWNTLREEGKWMGKY